MNTALIIQLLSGIVGGNVGGSLLRSIRSNVNLGLAGNSISGLVGGGLIGYVLNEMLAAKGLPSADRMTLTSIVFNIIGPAIGGIFAAIVAGLIKASVDK